MEKATAWSEAQEEEDDEVGYCIWNARTHKSRAQLIA
eukprot:CAMPEP_0185907138 /NCGR_PEP_ID=MMETSP0196C-20130402/6503_1 /TAXON_ID=2932 /ORGANISM="Alexandrium fundyense, Strain CCMP1719" /LENGTH=36 /DNA_ID= /DNA_START= /DNA_END= /DNA_ORIENTATION=